MHSSRSVRATVGAVALLLALSCSRAWCAAAPKVFTENWADQEKCVKLRGTSGTVCNETSGGKFAIKFSITSSTSGSSGTIDPTLLTTSSNNVQISLGGYDFQDTMGDFTVVSRKAKTTATHPIFTQVCNPQGTRCRNARYELITLTITRKGVLTIAVTATTGSDANGDTFESSIDAENFDGNASGPVTDNLSFEVTLGSFTFNSAGSQNVPVTGSVKTKPFKIHGTSANNLSTIKIQGTFKP